MSLVLNGSGIVSSNIVDGTIVNADVADLAASKLTGALPAISGAALTNLPGGGKVLQVVHTNLTSGFTTSTSTYADTGLTASITPTASSSYILVHIYANGVKHNGANQMGMKMFRGSTELEEWTSVSGYSDNTETAVAICFKDTPSTTSSTIYKVQANRKSGSGTARINNDVVDGYSMQSSVVLMEIEG